MGNRLGRAWPCFIRGTEIITLSAVYLGEKNGSCVSVKGQRNCSTVCL